MNKREILMKTITLSAREMVPDQPATLPAQIRAVLPGISQLPPAALEADLLLVPDHHQPVPTRRLIVLVPAGEIDEQALARRVWQLASCSGLSVLYLALSPDIYEVSYQRRRLSSLAAQTAYPHVPAGMNIHSEKNWSQALRYSLNPDDLLVCLADDPPVGFFRHQSLALQLTADLSLPVYQLGGLKVKPALSSHHWVKNVLGWIAAIALMAAFFWLQTGIIRTTSKPQATILLCLTVLVEIYSLWKFNEWIG